MSSRLNADLSAVDSSWELPVEKIGRRFGTLPPRRAGAGVNDDSMEVVEMEIEPEMIVAADQPLAAGTRPSMTARVFEPPPAPPAADAPRFFNIPIAPPGTSSPPLIVAYKAAQASSIDPTLTTPRRLWRRPLATTKNHDATSIVSPLPPPTSPGMPGTVPDAVQPRPRTPRNWMTVGISAIATGAAFTTIMLLVSSRGPHVAPAQVTSVGVSSAAPLDTTAAVAPPHTALSAPAKPTTVPPAPRPRPHVATNLDAKHATPVHRPIATNAYSTPAAPAATKQPASVVTRERSVTAGTKTVGPAPKQPTKVAAKGATKAVTPAVTPAATPATKPPVGTATARTSTSGGPKLAARTQPPAATDTKTATRTAQPAARGTAQAKHKSVASIDPKPAATKKPATR